MVGVIWYRFVRYSGTDWSATLVPIRPLLWYRLERCAGTDSPILSENRKFIYGLVKQGARAREYEIALQWLMDGGLIHRVNSVKAPRMPLRSQVKPIVFR